MEISWTNFQKWIILEFDRIISFSEASKIRDIQIVTEREEAQERIRQLQLLAECLKKTEEKEAEEAWFKAAEEARSSEEATLGTEAEKESNQAMENSASDPAISRLENAVERLQERMDKQDTFNNEIKSMLQRMWEKMTNSTSSSSAL